MKTELLRFITDEILSGKGKTDLQPEDDLLTTEIIDSMGVMRLISFIETTYGVRVPPEDVTIENFMTVDTISDYLSLKSEHVAERHPNQ